MNNQKKAIALDLSDEMKKLLEEETKDDLPDKEFEGYLYRFEEYTLTEVVLLAKHDEEAREEYLYRVNKALNTYAQKIVMKNPYLDVTQVFITLQKTALSAVEIYDPKFEKPFVNLFRSMLKTAAKSVEKSTAIQYYRVTNLLGRKVSLEECLFQDSQTDEAQKVMLQIDLDRFLETLEGKERELLLLYSFGLGFREISEMVGMPVSTVSYWIYKLIDRAKVYFGVK